MCNASSGIGPLISDANNFGKGEINVTDTSDLEVRKIETKRSAVRRWVTYYAIVGYLVLAAFVVVWLMWAGRYELAIGVLSGVASLAGSISGFWFGSRRPALLGSNSRPDDTPRGQSLS